MSSFHRQQASGFTRGPRISDLMTPTYQSFVDSSAAAERVGDAATALEFHIGVPMFSRSAHRVTLTQLAGLSEEMTPWLWARWAAYQCTRVDSLEDEPGRIVRASLDYTTRMFYADRIEETYLAGDDPVQVLATLAGEGWLFHQICTFEMVGLEAFLDELAGGRLAEEAALARSWVGAEMGAYHLERAARGELVLHDVGGDREVRVLDLGGAAHADDGGWLLGRLVPSGVSPELMFDNRPIPIDEETALAVVSGPQPASWITAVKEAIDVGRIDRGLFESEDRELVTDVPSLSLVETATRPAALASTLANLGRGRDEVGRAAYRILREVAEGRFGGDERAPYVAAAVVNVHAHAEALRHLVGTGGPDTWTRWAELVPDPARSRLRELAGLASAA